MEIIIKCENANALKNAIIRAVEDKKLKTWEVRVDCNNERLLTHVTSTRQWQDDAMLYLESDPSIDPLDYDKLIVGIAWWENRHEPDRKEQSYIIGRFTEVLLAHFSKGFVELSIEK